MAGNIGVGKSTLVEILAEDWGWQPYYELVEDHPYLADYYRERQRWGFHSQIWFLSQRFEQQQEINDTPVPVIQDRSIYEDYEVFVKGLLEQGILSYRDFRTYRRLYLALLKNVVPPSLIIFLQADVPTLQARIAQRARPSEQGLPDAYLAQLNHRYDAWLQSWRLCPVVALPTDGVDVLRDPAARQRVLATVRDAVAQHLPGVRSGR